MVVVKPSGVREDRDGALQQRFVRMVAAQRAADAHTVPGVRNAEAVAAEYVDAVRLANRPDLARVVHRDFLGDHDDLLRARGFTRTSSATPSRTPDGGR